MDIKAHANELIKEWELCNRAKPKYNPVDVRLEKNRCEELIIQLTSKLLWATDEEVLVACQKVEPILKALREKMIIEVLQNGSV